MVGFFSATVRKQRKMLSLLGAGVKIYGDGIRLASQPHKIKDIDTVAAFYGVDRGTIGTFLRVRGMGFPFVYIDNGYVGRNIYFRVTWNALMAKDGATNLGAESNGKRFEKSKIKFSPWRTGGKHILVALQSELYFELLVGMPRNEWIKKVCKEIRLYTDRPIIVREKPGFEMRRHGIKFIPLENQLEYCHAVVTWNSTVALEAIQIGVPAFCMDPNNSFKIVCPADLSRIENPLRSARRRELFEWLCDNQWSREELSNGLCWTVIRDQC